MTKEIRPRSVDAGASEDLGSNPSANPAIGDIIAERLSRRDLLMSGLLAVSAMSVTAPAALFAPGARAADGASPFNFPEVPAGSDETHHVADGYDADVLIRWGDAVLPEAPAFDPLAQTGAAQARQFGYNNDFIGYFPLDGKSGHGLLVVNHEYTNEELMFPGVGVQERDARFAAITPDLAAVEMMAHGGSVIEIQKTDGKWAVVPNSKYARRITAETEIRVSGPAAGDARMKTSADPTGLSVKGMLNNCAGGVTPWGTWLTCEENINYYFWNKAAAEAHPDARALRRYGIPGEYANWGAYHDRFDIGKEPNEPNRFGWVVEIDPFDPNSVPVKRTAMGRFKHEGAGNIVNKDGRFVVYQGDDERFDYVYKFVTRDAVDLTDPAKNKDILDHGTLYAARFDAGGTGEWLPLAPGGRWLVPDFGFSTQADILIHARLAADMLGATKMDRPEDIEANPKTGKVYVMLTLNEKREETGVKGVNPANPRPANKFGHIIEITPSGGDHAAAAFTWEFLVKCGDPSVAAVGATFNPATSKDGWFGMPDNCVIDAEGRLWIATDGNSPEKTGRADGIWGLETEGAGRGTSKLFFRCPNGAEMCGPCFTPDMETFFVAVQHPGEGEDAKPGTFENPATRWPDFKPDMPPRPSVVAITKKGGGKIGV